MYLLAKKEILNASTVDEANTLSSCILDVSPFRSIVVHQRCMELEKYRLNAISLSQVWDEGRTKDAFRKQQRVLRHLRCA